MKPGSLPSDPDADLDRLIKESEEAIRRFEAAQAGKKGPLVERIARQWRRRKIDIANVALAGSVLAVSIGRLIQKQEYETQKEAWEEERRKLTVERNRVSEQLQAHQLSTERLVQQLEAAAARGGRQLGDDVLGVLRKYKDTQAQLQQMHSPAVVALLHSAGAEQGEQQQQQQQQGEEAQPGEEAPPPSDGGKPRPGGGRLMV